MAARFCPKCGQETSSAAQFCARCGSPLGAGAAVATREHTTARMDVAARKTRRLLVPLVVAALIVLTVAVALMANRLHQESLLASHSTPPPAAPPLTNAPAPPLAAAAPLTNAPAQAPPAAAPLTNAPGTGPGHLPPDAAAYVQFLKGIEDQRVALDNDSAAYSGINSALTQAVSAHNSENSPDGQEAPAQAPQGGDSNGSQVNQSLSIYEAKWQTLISSFRSQSPPASCTQLANNYFLFLSDDFNVVVKLNVGVLGLLSKKSDEPSGSNSGTHDLSSDLLKTQTKRDQEGTAADGALADLCARYNAPKPFSIQPEGSAPSLLGQ